MRIASLQGVAVLCLVAGISAAHADNTLYTAHTSAGDLTVNTSDPNYPLRSPTPPAAAVSTCTSIQPINGCETYVPTATTVGNALVLGTAPYGSGLRHPALYAESALVHPASGGTSWLVYGWAATMDMPVLSQMIQPAQTSFHLSAVFDLSVQLPVGVPGFTFQAALQGQASNGSTMQVFDQSVNFVATGSAQTSSLALEGDLPQGFDLSDLKLTFKFSDPSLQYTSTTFDAVAQLRSLSITPTVVPEPATGALIGLGLGAVAAGARRRRC